MSNAWAPLSASAAMMRLAGGAGCATGAPSSDEALVTAASQHDLALVGQALGDLQDALLLGLDVRQAHRALAVQVLAQRLGGARTHVGEHLLAQLGLGAL